jgi:aminoglycoside phosphotransferase (APT) family kinase protein
MHDDELDIDDAHVRLLVADQFPHWRSEHVQRLPGSGTVNAIFRIGSGLTARFPLNARDPGEVAVILKDEASALDELADRISFAAPRHVAFGAAGEGYPLPWSVQTWVDGEPPTASSHADAASLARDLASLIASIREAPTLGRPFRGTGRGGELPSQDEWIDTGIRRSADQFDPVQLTAMWAALRVLPRHDGDAMTHGDLIPANLLVADGRLTGVLDGGGFGPADPALDLVCAWHLFDAGAREALRTALAVGPTQWLRGAAWAFAQAMGLAWYYRSTNPVMAELGRSTIRRLIMDADIAALTRG